MGASTASISFYCLYKLVWLVDLAPQIKKTIITFMRVKSGIMAATTVVLSLIEGILAVR